MCECIFLCGHLPRIQWMLRNEKETDKYKEEETKRKKKQNTTNEIYFLFYIAQQVTTMLIFSILNIVLISLRCVFIIINSNENKTNEIWLFYFDSAVAIRIVWLRKISCLSCESLNMFKFTHAI